MHNRKRWAGHILDGRFVKPWDRANCRATVANLPCWDVTGWWLADKRHQHFCLLCFLPVTMVEFKYFSNWTSSRDILSFHLLVVDCVGNPVCLGRSSLFHLLNTVCQAPIFRLRRLENNMAGIHFSPLECPDEYIRQTGLAAFSQRNHTALSVWPLSLSSHVHRLLWFLTSSSKQVSYPALFLEY